MSRIAWRALFIGLFATIFTIALTRKARAEPPAPTVDLYTIGPTPEFPSRFGHSLLCVHPAGKDSIDDGTCYDYGVPDREDIGHVIWTAMRMEPSFIPVAIEEKAAVRFFRKQGRAIERQRLPINADEATRLISALDTEARERRAYAYHPYYQNCATKLRDHIDAATNGRLHQGPSTIPHGGFRDYMEEGHGGHADILTVMALYLGEGNDKQPSPWEAMLLPTQLRNGVAERLSAPVEKVDDALEPFEPGSRAVGRITIIVFAVVMSILVRVLAKRNRLGLGLAIVGGALGFFAITLEIAASVVRWTEVSHNWSLLLFLPTDLLLPFLARAPQRLALYLKVRIGMAILFAILEVANVIHQPILPLAALVAIVMLGALSALRNQSKSSENNKKSEPVNESVARAA